MNTTETITTYPNGCLTRRCTDGTETAETQILFVRGVGSDIPTYDSNDLYKAVKGYFIGKNNGTFTVHWFEYKNTDMIEHVIEDFENVITKIKPTIVIGHSMGGFILCNYIKSVTPVISSNINNAIYC